MLDPCIKSGDLVQQEMGFECHDLSRFRVMDRALEIRFYRFVMHQVPCYHLDRNVPKFIHQCMRRFPVQLQPERLSEIIDEMRYFRFLLLPEIVSIGWKALYTCSYTRYRKCLGPGLSAYVGV